MSDLKKYFAINGKMYSATVIAELDFAFTVVNNKETCDSLDKKRYLSAMFNLPTNNMGTDIYNDGIAEYAARPGKWYFMTGYTVIHSDDTFDTREEAAQAEYDKLMAS